MTACSSDKDVLQPTLAPSTPQVTVRQVVGFDTYLSGTTASTRAGDTGVMTTEKLKTLNKGFGVFAMFQDGTENSGNYSSGTFDPDFMYNEHVSWNNGWSYSPLKYWPNETTKDSQSPAAEASQTDKLSFFAYAPYVSTGTGNTLDTKATNMELNIASSNKISAYEKAETSGILRISSEDYSGDPKVEWGYSANPDENVDLLWGVAPAGFSYTNVSGSTTSVPVGMPLKDLVKPDKDQKVKFLFQHALSRISLSVVSAVDQIAAGDDGGTFTSDPTTKVLIKNVQVWGDFGKNGVLNLNNTVANTAEWIDASIAKSDDADANPLFWFDNGTAIGASAPYNTANSYIAPELRYVASQITAVGTSAANFANVNTGVLPSEQPLLAQVVDPSKVVNNGVASTPAYEFGKVYYYKDANNDYVIATVPATNQVAGVCAVYIKDPAGNYIQVKKADATVQQLDGKTKYYRMTIGAMVTAAESPIAPNAVYYTRSGSTDGEWVFTYHKNETGATINDASLKRYTISNETLLTSTNNYASQIYYTGLMPRYFMVIPTGSTPIKIKITYAVVTKDEKLTGNVSNVENDITKTVTVDLKNGKSYNLKLILGLTSVKLDATVADWKVADETEIWLPQNNE